MGGEREPLREPFSLLKLVRALEAGGHTRHNIGHKIGLDPAVMGLLAQGRDLRVAPAGIVAKVCHAFGLTAREVLTMGGMAPDAIDALVNATSSGEENPAPPTKGRKRRRKREGHPGTRQGPTKNKG